MRPRASMPVPHSWWVLPSVSLCNRLVSKKLGDDTECFESLVHSRKVSHWRWLESLLEELQLWVHNRGADAESSTPLFLPPINLRQLPWLHLHRWPVQPVLRTPGTESQYCAPLAWQRNLQIVTVLIKTRNELCWMVSCEGHLDICLPTIENALMANFYQLRFFEREVSKEVWALCFGLFRRWLSFGRRG